MTVNTNLKDALFFIPTPKPPFREKTQEISDLEKKVKTCAAELKQILDDYDKNKNQPCRTYTQTSSSLQIAQPRQARDKISLKHQYTQTSSFYETDDLPPPPAAMLAPYESIPLTAQVSESHKKPPMTAPGEQATVADLDDLPPPPAAMLVPYESIPLTAQVSESHKKPPIIAPGEKATVAEKITYFNSHQTKR